jgi:type I restriction enzyme S subunit
VSAGDGVGFAIDPAKVREWKRYPEYTDSGVEWLGEVPAGWELKRLKYYCQMNPSKSEVSSVPKDTQVSFLPMELIGEDGALSLSQNRLIEDVWEGYTYFRDGDVVIAKITPCFENGKGALCDDLKNGIAFGTTELYVLRPQDKVTPEFLFLVTRSQPFRKIGADFMTGTAGQKRVPDDFIRNFLIGVPPLPEQQAIAAFLDRETARLDALIEKKQRFIELLEEKRQALITQAVTKGLDPDVEMKDSGVEWLGEVPVGWVVSRLGLISESLQTGPFGSQLHSSDYIEDGIPVINPSNIRDGAVVPDPKCTVDDKTLKRLKRHRLAEGDIVFARRGDMGRCASINSETEGFLCGTGCIRIRLNQNTYPEFLRAYLSTPGVKSYLLVESVGSTMDNLNTNILSRVPIVSPSFDEQKTIMKNLSARINKVDKIFLNVKESIEKLHEYRTALISAAVTGKIDVRSEVDAT